MYTAILSLAAAAASIIGMLFFSMQGGTSTLLIILAIAIGTALDPTLDRRRHDK